MLFFGQPVAVVVATTLEAAQHGASLVKVAYDAEEPSTDLSEAPAERAADTPAATPRPALRDARRCGWT